ncbi:MAG: (d)CMP kinase [Armatimonadia bacterium]|nr:(d)CMP kinase [Armatimonadia bacterium]
MTPARERPIVAIDGPAGAGKSTAARAVAERLGYAYIDTGAMYRCVALRCLRGGVDPADAGGAAAVAEDIDIEFQPLSDGGQWVVMDGEDVSAAIREDGVSDAASHVSAHARVREVMVQRQRELGHAGGVVMEGRDIQTNVFPDAEVKVFLSASPKERARRRAGDLRDRGLPVPSVEELTRSIAERDHRDATRATAPLAAAPDATTINTDGMSIEQVVDRVAALAGAVEGDGCSA